jgi:hypothetical protein
MMVYSRYIYTFFNEYTGNHGKSTGTVCMYF